MNYVICSNKSSNGRNISMSYFGGPGRFEDTHEAVQEVVDFLLSPQGGFWVGGFGLTVYQCNLRVYIGILGIMEKKMEITISGLELKV